MTKKLLDTFVSAVIDNSAFEEMDTLIAEFFFFYLTLGEELLCVLL